MPGDIALVRSLADASGHLAVVAVTRPDGTVHASLVSAGVTIDPVSGDPSVGVVVSGASRKLAHLRQSGRASVTFSAGFRWVSVEGPVRLVGPHDRPAEEIDVARTLRAVFVDAGGSHEDWSAFDAVMAAEERCAAFIALGRILAN